MELSIFFMILLAVGVVISFLLYLAEYLENKKLYRDYRFLKEDIERSYFKKTDARIYNAVQKAYEVAKEENHEFEIKEYENLLKEIKGMP